MIHQLMPKPPAIALLQGGLANQLLQAALITNEEQIPVSLLSVSDCLFNSRLRSSRSVTKRSISSLFEAQVYCISRYRQAYLRMRLHLPLGRETLHDGALCRVYSHGQRVYKGDGLSPGAFSSEYNCFWFSVLRALDKLFGDPPLPANSGNSCAMGRLLFDQNATWFRFISSSFALLFIGS